MMSEKETRFTPYDLLPPGEPFPGETLRSDGWVYRDLRRLTHDAWEKLEGIIGKENIRFLSWADYGNAVRGQCFISQWAFKI